MNFKIVIAILSLSILVGCNKFIIEPKVESKVETNPFSLEDMCIINTKDSGEICYGMNRNDAEKTLGAVLEEGKSTVLYDHKVNIGYSDEKVYSIHLGVGSEGIYKTTRGAEIGLHKEDIKKLYGSKEGIELGETELTYLFNMEKEAYYESMDEYFEEIKSVLNQAEDDTEKLQDIFQFSIGIGPDGLVDSLYMKDARGYEVVY
ncbi:hypothetical protein [Chengkuizengella axinellae]|uniref:DUF1307 domain-containing protein n=1 Tax=Chengkuizengella axinellae TaxID=3064388 RepID=A0ABT9IWS8_9BACL|nr:hypothetical protein [Chengkuizengella sp. 2205SS18-9]MDP5273240.1 hypothetical protein [Chengkuizengella sp. 2205SS18-9]